MISLHKHQVVHPCFSYYVFNEREGVNISHLGDGQWHLALCLLISWTVVFLCIFKGIKTSGKVRHMIYMQ